MLSFEMKKQIHKHSKDRVISDPAKYVKKLMPKTYKALGVWFTDEMDKAKDAGRGAHSMCEFDRIRLTNTATDFLKGLAYSLTIPTDIRKNLDSGIAYRVTNKSPDVALQWAKGRIHWADKAFEVLPEPYCRLNTDKKRKKLGLELAGRCAQIITDELNMIGDGEDGCPISIVEKIDEKCGLSLWLCNGMPVRKRYKRKAYGAAIAGRARAQAREVERFIHFLSDIQQDKYWTRQITNRFMVAAENARRAVGMVCANVSPYASYTARAIIAQRVEAQSEWAKNMIVVSECGQSMSLKDVQEKSLSNPAVRRAELMTRLSGLEEYSKTCDHVAVFVTMTAPSRFHRLKKRGKFYIDNPKWNGEDARDAQEWLKISWSRFRAYCKDNDIVFYGMRVVEPHVDGTPHWHGVFFMSKKDRVIFTRALRYYQMQRDGDELRFADSGKPASKAIKGRVDVKPIQDNKGSAVGYIAKYISKNIDGYKMEGQKSDESAKVDIAESVDAVTAWARINRFRQFQFVGGGSATVWRELRRIDSDIAENDRFEELRAFADSGDYASYYAKMGGHLCPKKYASIKPCYVAYSDLAVGKVHTKVHGLRMGCFELCTRLKVWKMQKAVDVDCDLKISVLGLVSITVGDTLKGDHSGGDIPNKPINIPIS